MFLAFMLGLQTTTIFWILGANVLATVGKAKCFHWDLVMSFEKGM